MAIDAASSQNQALTQISKVSYIDQNAYQVSTPTDIILNEFQQHIARQTELHAGYPYNLNYDYTALLPFLQYTLNNLGDPFVNGNYGIHSREFEKECIHWLAKLYELENPWGYVTTCGTEGNLYGLFLGRELYEDGILYFSEDTHYSVKKAARLYRIPYVVINSQPNGEIDYEDLEQQLATRQDKSAIVNINLGTTLKGAVDRIEKTVDILNRLNISFYIHCDGALAGLLLPFIDDAPRISFKDYPIGSIAVSGHKFIGSPFPCGMVLARSEYVKKIEAIIEYIGSTDTTIMGSRNGLAPLFLWYAINTRSNQFSKEVAACIENARYFYNCLLQIGYSAMLNDFSNTVVFEKPGIDLCHKWQLATQGDLAHIVVMQNVDKDKLDKFLDELLKDKITRSFYKA